jgi:ferrous iron transport protein A
MTPLAARLGERRFAVPGDSDGPGAARSLAELRPRESGRIVGYAPDLPAGHSRRLFDLGFAPGAEVFVVRRAPALDPWIYRTAGVEIALRRGLARHILVVRP